MAKRVLRSVLGVFVLVGACMYAREARAQLVRLGSAASATAGPVALSGRWPETANPASLAGSYGLLVAVHAARPYHLPSLHLARLQVGYGGRKTTVAASLERLGYDAFGQTTATAALAGVANVSAQAELALGARVSVRQAVPTGYDGLTSATVDAGWIASFDSLLSVGAAVSISTRPTAEASGRPAVLSAGLAARLRETTWVSARVEREEGFPMALGFGAEMRIDPSFVLRAGTTTAPVQLCGGFGLRVGRLLVDVAVTSHRALGLSSSITVSYRGD